jgi:aminoglycoside phosphotransferase (APT) family kinase protein
MIDAVDRTEITAEVATRLVAGQFPQWAGLPVVPVAVNGWDNTTFRLGGELSVRLPSADGYTEQVAKEHRWLPVLAPQLPLPVPEPVALGSPTAEFNRPWSVYRWLPGEPAGDGSVTDLVTFASDLAGFLRALQAADAHGGPPAGEHNFYRGGSLEVYDEQTRDLLRQLADEVDAAGAAEVWNTARRSAWEGRPVWVHGDVTGTNLLVSGGALSAVIDFGGLAVGDPACDLVMQWTYFTGDSAAAFREGLGLDDATWARGRGWALWKALLMIAEELAGRSDAADAMRRLGWRRTPREIVALAIADHASAT